MCILAWHWQPGAATELLLVANRDEAYDRPAAPLQVWEDGRTLAGKDLRAGGTWMGVGRGRRFAALTNYRTGQRPDPLAPSRGMLVRNFLSGTTSAEEYLLQLAPRSPQFNPFNLLVWDGITLLGLEGRHGRVVALQSGWGAVSNADFHTPWPKVQRLQAGLQGAVEAATTGDDDLLALLADRTPAVEAELPSTGVGLATERALSSVFIRTSGYGTRASSVVRLHASAATFTELTYVGGEAGERTSMQIGFEKIGG